MASAEFTPVKNNPPFGLVRSRKQPAKPSIVGAICIGFVLHKDQPYRLVKAGSKHQNVLVI
ncbi:hypothetical protein Aazo_2921 ['Nostoc azollae' 0708]|jgi:hypothetical protein|uniref:Uncharacterized protein n=1 Tax=Nostoc azollae (strain 0708) TaxID=551115 RepID=D7E167_NOSA0|nr:hypothetical protein Aazo_2921 ['Nostoc azollae' 0708]